MPRSQVEGGAETRLASRIDGSNLSRIDSSETTIRPAFQEGDHRSRSAADQDMIHVRLA